MHPYASLFKGHPEDSHIVLRTAEEPLAMTGLKIGMRG
jgi:hypothetical protein